MPNVDKNAPLVTNSDAAMWRQDHDAAKRYIEALLAEGERWAPGDLEAARGMARKAGETGRLLCKQWHTSEFRAAARRSIEAANGLHAVIAAALKEEDADG